MFSVVLVLLAMATAGCALQGTKKPVPAATYEQLMQQAAASLGANDTAHAKELYHKAAATDPTRQSPWYQLAKIAFQEQDYGSAIVDAREVLQRDPANIDAQRLLTISGLRVAVLALGSLHEETDPQGPAHQEAEELVKKMRDVLGQDVLVPPASTKRSTRHRRVGRRSAPTTAKGATEKSQDSSAPTTATNPFQALPGRSSD